MKTFFLLFTLSVVTVSCSKNSEDHTDATAIAGFWKGSYVAQYNGPVKPMMLLVKGDGSFRMYTNKEDTAAADKAIGTFKLSGTEFNARYQFPGYDGSYSLVADLVEGKQLDGEWSMFNSPFKGEVNLVKQ